MLAKYPGKEMEERLPADINTFLKEKNRQDSFVLAVMQVWNALFLHKVAETTGLE